jgi:hypothetical protein
VNRFTCIYQLTLRTGHRTVTYRPMKIYMYLATQHAIYAFLFVLSAEYDTTSFAVLSSFPSSPSGSMPLVKASRPARSKKYLSCRHRWSLFLGVFLCLLLLSEHVSLLCRSILLSQYTTTTYPGKCFSASSCSTLLPPATLRQCDNARRGRAFFIHAC